MTAHMLYIMKRFFEESACYSVHIDGTCEMGNTFVGGLKKFGGKIQLNAHVDANIVENGRATGVRLKNGSIVKAKKAVVSIVTPFDTVKMLGPAQELPEGFVKWRE
jgi:phytoene dehydrogenase-like protein